MKKAARSRDHEASPADPAGRSRDTLAPSARERILVEAERLFARNGVHGTALREIAERSGIAINLISYHFKTKDDLFREILRGHSARVTAIRREMLTELELRHSPGMPPIADIVATLFRPIFLMREDDPELWAGFVGMLNKERGSAIWRETIGGSVGAMLKQYALLLHRALPSARRGDIVFTLSLAFLSFTLTSPAEARSIVGEDLYPDWEEAGLEERLVRTVSRALQLLA